MRRIGRILLVVLSILIVLGTAAEVARRYFISPEAASMVTARLQDSLGVPVQLGEADVGWSSTTLRDLKLYEKGASPLADVPWAVVRDLKADVSVQDLIGGETKPTSLTLSGPTITLRFDAEGKLLTQLPAAKGEPGSLSPADLPAVRLEQGTVTLQQQDRPAFVISGIDAELQPRAEGLVLTGTVTDPQWGRWELDGRLEGKTNRVTLTLTSPPIRVTQEMLTRLPFVPASVWREVRAEGETPVELTLCYDPAAQEVKYRVVLQPEQTTVTVAAIDLTANQARGRVVVDNGLVELHDVEGRTAGGTLRTTAALDFRGEVARLNFESVTAQRLELDRLPKSWSVLPPDVERALSGEPKLSGTAHLRVTIKGDEVWTDGKGEGQITDAHLFDSPVKSLTIALVSDGKGFRFIVPQPMKGAAGPSHPLPLVAALVLGQVGPGPDVLDPPPEPAAARRINWFRLGVLFARSAWREYGDRFLRGVIRTAAGLLRKPMTGGYLEITLEMENVDLERIVQQLDLRLPFAVKGRGSFKVEASIPVNTPRDLQTYRLKGSADLPRLALEGLEFEQVQARVSYAEGILRLDELTGRIPAGATAGGPPGTLKGTAELEVVPTGDLTARLTLEQIPLARVLSLVPGASERFAGRFDGKIEARVPAARLGTIDAWQASGTITAQRLTGFGLTLADARATVSLRRGRLAVTGLRGQLEGTAVSGSATLELAAPFHFQGKVQMHEGDLAVLQRIAPEFRPPFPVAGRFEVTAEARGALAPFSIKVAGTGAGTDLVLREFRVGAVKFRWESDTQRVRILDLQARLYDGAATGAATLPLQPDVPGSLDLRFDKIDLATLVKSLPDVPLRLEGHASGTLHGTLTAAGPNRPRDVTAKLAVEAPQLWVQNFPAERVRGDFIYDPAQGIGELRLEGETADGRFRLTVRLPGAKPKPAPGEGMLRLEGVRLTQLWEPLGVSTTLGPLSGTLDLDLTFRLDAADWRPTTGSGRLRLEGLRWGDLDLIASLSGDVRLAGGLLELLDLTGPLGGGLVRGQVTINLDRPDRSWFLVSLDRVESAELLAPWPELAAQVEGPIEARLRSTIGAEWHGSGQVVLTHGRVFGAEVSEWRFPLDWTLAPHRGRGHVEVRESTAQVALGRVIIQATVGWGVGTRTEGTVRFVGLDLRTLLHQVSRGGPFGAGRVTGRLDFAGTDMQSLDDLTATLQASFQQAQPLDLPVLRQVAPYVLPGMSSSATFQSGAVRARLARGIVRVEQLTLVGRLAQLFIEGTVTLDGRLNLEVTARTAQLGVPEPLLAPLGLRLPAEAGPLPLSFLTRASGYLSNRVIHLRVTGTVRSPTVRIEPVSILTEEAVRFFLGRMALPVLF
jgi:translocation and assembly module TamB